MTALTWCEGIKITARQGLDVRYHLGLAQHSRMCHRTQWASSSKQYIRFLFLLIFVQIALIGAFTSKNTQTGDNSLGNAIIISPRQSVPPISFRLAVYVHALHSSGLSRIINPSFKCLEHFNMVPVPVTVPVLPQHITSFNQRRFLTKWKKGQPASNCGRTRKKTHFFNYSLILPSRLLLAGGCGWGCVQLKPSLA